MAMYNAERRCAVIRVIEVTDDLLKNDETTRAEALVGEPAARRPGGRAGGVGEHEAFSCLCPWGNVKRSRCITITAEGVFYFVAVATETLITRHWFSDTATRAPAASTCKSLFRAV